MKNHTATNRTSSTSQVPPSDLHAERALLGSILLGGDDVLDDVAPIVGPDDFYLAAHADIFRQMLRLRERDEPLDTIVIHDAVRKSLGNAARDGAVSEELLIEAMESVPHRAHAVYYARIVADKSRRRRLQYLASDLAMQARDETFKVSNVVATAMTGLQAIGESSITSHTFTAAELAHDFIRRLDEGAQPGLLTGFGDLNRLIGGLHPEQLIILAARPSIGKTSLAGNIALNVADSGTPVLFISLEQSHAEITDRFIASTARISTYILRARDRSEAQQDAIVRAAAEFANLPVFLADRASLSVSDIAILGRIHRRKDKIGLLLVDYLQLIAPADRRAPREQQVAQIARDLKSLARELKVPIIALAQLSRDIERRDNKRPRLSDLRESGAIEQDADIVMFLDRPGKDDENADAADRSAASIIVAKQRNGDTGDVPLHWDGPSMTFSNAAHGSRRPEFPPGL